MQVAKYISDVATDETQPILKTKNPVAVVFWRLDGKKGGITITDSLTPERRTTIAKTSAVIRWKKESKQLIR